MPYSESGSDVPSRIKGKKKRRQWAAVWNSSYESHHDEGRAFAEANAVYNKAESDELIKYGEEFGASLSSPEFWYSEYAPTYGDEE